jgi:hypothetical protein
MLLSPRTKIGLTASGAGGGWRLNGSGGQQEEVSLVAARSAVDVGRVIVCGPAYPIDNQERAVAVMG